MKKNVRRLALFLAMVMALTASAFAATQGQYDDIVENGAAVAENELTGSAFGEVYLAAGSAEITIVFYGAEYPEKAHVTYTDASKIHVDDMFLVTLLTKNANGEYVPGDGNIQYIDQVTCTVEGKIEFDVYPSAVTDGIIAIYGAAGELLVAVVEGAYLLGDVNEDTFIDAFDALAILKYAANADLYPLSDKAKMAANVNGDEFYDAFDALLILRYAATDIDKFPIE